MTGSKTALTASGSTEVTVLEALADASIAQNYGKGGHGDITDNSVTSEGGAMTVTAQAEVETTFVKITGIETVSIQANETVSTISVNRKDMEVALVTDMSGDRDLESIKTAAPAASDVTELSVMSPWPPLP